MRKAKLIALVAVVALSLAWAYMLGMYSGPSGKGLPLAKEAQAAGGRVTGPNTVAPERYVYYPGTEKLANDEVRVACGTGMPDQRRGQASACFFFEFGNGEKLIFDLGTGLQRPGQDARRTFQEVQPAGSGLAQAEAVVQAGQVVWTGDHG